MKVKLSAKKMIAIGFGANAFEWYDFSIYAYLANTLGILFFDEKNSQLALIKALFIFSISFLVRPIGSIIFGYLGDKYGRKFSLSLSLILMALPTFFIGLLPTYKNIGIYAVSLLIILRVIQGLAAGGELPGTTCYLYEIAPTEKRNFFCSLVACSTMVGMLLGSFITYLLHLFYNEQQIQNAAWRLPFLLSGGIFFFILTFRRMIVETMEFPERLQSFCELFLELFSLKKVLLQIFLLNGFIAISFYLLFVWLPSYLLIFNHLPATIVFVSSSLSLLVLIFLTFLVGYLVHFTNRKKCIIFSIILTLTLVYPLFKLLESQSLSRILIAQLLFALSLCFIYGVINSTMASSFNKKIRYSGISISYTFAMAILGGLAPTLCSILIYVTGLKEAPILFLSISALAALFAALSLPSA